VSGGVAASGACFKNLSFGSGAIHCASFRCAVASDVRDKSRRYRVILNGNLTMWVPGLRIFAHRVNDVDCVFICPFNANKKAANYRGLIYPNLI